MAAAVIPSEIHLGELGGVGASSDLPALQPAGTSEPDEQWDQGVKDVVPPGASSGEPSMDGRHRSSAMIVGLLLRTQEEVGD
jgi:hypothetical protein